MSNFVNLHLHTEYSLQDSVIKIADLIELLKKYNQTACAITDHSSLAGHLQFYNECMNNDIKPILGNEFYCLPYYHKNRNRFHLVALVKNEMGLKNLRKLQRIAVQNFYHKPIISYKDLFRYKEGLFFTSACSLGPISQAILNNQLPIAEELLNKFLIEFGKNNFALEFQFHPEYADQAIINEELLELYNNNDIEYIIATCDSHFLNEDDRDLRRKIQAAAWHKKIEDINPSLKSNCVGNEDIIIQNAKESKFSDISLVSDMIKIPYEIIENFDEIKFNNNERKIPKFNKHQSLERLLNKQVW